MSELVKLPAHALPCISLVGMAGAGKSTVGVRLASALGWAFMDSDHLIEAIYGVRLQDVTDALGKDAFLDVECAVIRAINASRTVIATGGSVVYRGEAVQHLASLGPVVHLKVRFPEIERRIARNPERGLAIGPGQSLEDIYREREELYMRAATLHCPADNLAPDQCVQWILRHLPEGVQGRRQTAGIQ